jgi:hypothetical protein
VSCDVFVLFLCVWIKVGYGTLLLMWCAVWPSAPCCEVLECRGWALTQGYKDQ